MSIPSIVPLILCSVLCAVGGQVTLKKAMNRVGRVGRRQRGSWRAGLPGIPVGLAFYGVSMFLWLYTLSRVELSYAFPFISLSYVAIVLAARFQLGERLTRTRLAGSALIVLGVLLVGLSA